MPSPFWSSIIIAYTFPCITTYPPCTHAASLRIHPVPMLHHYVSTLYPCCITTYPPCTHAASLRIHPVPMLHHYVSTLYPCCITTYPPCTHAASLRIHPVPMLHHYVSTLYPCCITTYPPCTHASPPPSGYTGIPCFQYPGTSPHAHSSPPGMPPP